jgi:hypothetical protein
VRVLYIFYLIHGLEIVLLYPRLSFSLKADSFASQEFFKFEVVSFVSFAFVD